MRPRDENTKLLQGAERATFPDGQSAAYALLMRYRNTLVHLESANRELVLLDEADEFVPISLEKLKKAFRLLYPNGDIEQFVAQCQKDSGVGKSDSVNRVVEENDQTLKPIVEDARSPRVARFALLLMPRKNREHLIGDLEEEYRTVVLPEHGQFWAQFWYWEQTVLALGFYVWPFVKRALGIATIWKVIGR